MREILCPHCKKAFKIDEAGYEAIVKQIRDGEFAQELHERLELALCDQEPFIHLGGLWQVVAERPFVD